MGTRERRQRELDHREQLILDKARELIRAEGLLNLQMARVAENCEYAVGTLYQHFACKEDLLLALTCQDIQRHAELVEPVLQWQATPRDRMFALAVADLLFVRRCPDHFRIAQYVFCEVVWNAASPERRQALLDAQAPIAAAAVAIVEDAVAAGSLQLNGLSPSELGIAMWSQVVGMHNLVHAEGVLRGMTGVQDAYRLMCRHIQALFNGLGWGPMRVLDDTAALNELIDRICREVFHDGCSTQDPTHA